MPNQPPEIVEKYEVLFGARTGVTVLLPVVKAFDGTQELSLAFRLSAEGDRDIVVEAPNRPVILKNLKKDFLDEAIERGFIMFYETRDDEVVRCTPCRFLKQ